MQLEVIKNDVVKKGKFYLKWRTTIWATVWFAVGLFGGNADRLQEKIPTLKYSNEEIGQKIQEYNQLKEKLIKTKEELDKIQSEGYN